MSGYDNDRRVVPHPGGTWMVFTPDAELNVAPMRDRGTLAVIPDRFAVFDAAGNFLGNVGPFDEVIYSLIGDPQ